VAWGSRHGSRGAARKLHGRQLRAIPSKQGRISAGRTWRQYVGNGEFEIGALDSKRSIRGGTRAMELGLAAVARMRRTAAAFQRNLRRKRRGEKNDGC
jgi:hypothetical protein